MRDWVLMDEPFGALDALTRAHLPRPRDRLALAEDPRFNRLRQQVLRFLYAKHRFPQGGSRTRSGAGAPEALVAVV
jgi:nitrate/nitrite transport system ATP-binding protein